MLQKRFILPILFQTELQNYKTVQPSNFWQQQQLQLQ